jgi:hypothetical protein
LYQPTNDEWEDVSAGEWEDVEPAGGGSSLDSLLSTPRGQGPTVGDEVGVPRDTTAPMDVREGPSALWQLAAPGGAGALAGMMGGPDARALLGRGTAKGLGQAGVNLWNTIDALGPESAQAQVPMPEWLQTEAGGAEGAGAFLGRVTPGVLAGAAMPQTIPAQMLAGGISGAAERGTPTGAAMGAAGAGILTGGARIAPKALQMAAPVLTKLADSPIVQSGMDVASAVGPPGLARFAALARLAGRGAKRFAPKDAISSVDEARAALMAKEAAEAESAMFTAHLEDKARVAAKAAAAAKSEAAAAKAQEAARAAGESRAADFDDAVSLAKEEAAKGLKMESPAAVVEAVGRGSAPAAARRAVPPSVVNNSRGVQLDQAVQLSKEEALSLLRGAKTAQERGAALSRLPKAERGAALSDATNKPLDVDDVTEAGAFLKEAGSLDEALRLIREHPENSVQDVIRLTRAVREASRRAK